MIFKNFSKVNFLRDTESTILAVSSNLYTKIKVIRIEIGYLEITLKISFKVVNIKYKFFDNKEIIDINSNNYFFSNEN